MTEVKPISGWHSVARCFVCGEVAHMQFTLIDVEGHHEAIIEYRFASWPKNSWFMISGGWDNYVTIATCGIHESHRHLIFLMGIWGKE